MPRSLAAAFLLLTAASALPPLLFHHIPLRDYPEHLVMAQVITRYDAADSDLCLWYRNDFRLAPYVGCYAVASALHPWVEPAWALRLCVAAALMATPLALLCYLRAVAPERWPAAFLGFGLLYTDHYYLGLVNFLMAVPPSLGALAALLSFARRPGGRPAAAFVALAALAYLSHAMGFLVTILAGGLQALLGPRGNRGRTLLLVAAVAVAAALLTPRGNVVPPERTWRYLRLGEDYPPPGPGRGLLFQSPAVTLLTILGHVANDAEGLDFAQWGIAAGALLVALRSRRGAAEPPARRERFVLPALALLLVFVLPAATSYVETVSMKMSAYLFLGAAALVPARLLDARTRGALVTFAAVAVTLGIVTGWRFQREAAGFDDVMAAVPPRPRLLTLVFEPVSDVLAAGAFRYDHYPQLVQAERGGMGMALQDRPQYPVRSRPEAEPRTLLYRDRPWLITADVMAYRPEYLLLKGRAGEKLLPPDYTLVTASGRFSLWRRGS